MPAKGDAEGPMTNRFIGFKPEDLAFLRDLAANNEAAWFKPRKEVRSQSLPARAAALAVACLPLLDYGWRLFDRSPAGSLPARGAAAKRG
jgi:hypothetical protein